jgi:dynein heavy chain
MISACKESVKGEGRLWEQNETVLLENLRNCLKLKNEYQRCYRLEKERLKQANKHANQFEFDELTLFGKFELFCSRISTLLELFETIAQFKALKKHNIDGMGELIDNFFLYVDELKRKSTDLLDYTKNSFDKDYMAFNKKITHLEQNLQVWINTSFENITSSEVALQLLKKFQQILVRESLQAELDNKYTVIFHNYGLQLEQIQKVYEKRKKNPPMVRNAPPVAGNLLWGRQLIRRVMEPMGKFQQIPIIKTAKESVKIIKKYNKVLLALFKFENLWMEAWSQSIEKTKAGLQATLLVEVDNKLYVNFDRNILQLIRETKWLKRMNVEVPESARMVLLQESKFKKYYSELWYVLRENLRVLDLVKKDTRQLLLPHLEDLAKKIEPGRKILTWTSMNIDVYLDRIHRGLQQFEDLVTKVNGTIDSRIQKNLRQIGKTLLVDLPVDDTFSLEQFVERHEKLVRTYAPLMNIRNVEIEQAASDLISVITSYPLEDNTQMPKDEITKLKKHFDSMMLRAILSSTTKSLNTLKSRIRGAGFNDTPFFNVEVDLTLPTISLFPALDDIQEAVDRTAVAILSCSKYLNSWTYEGVEPVHKSYHFNVARDPAVVRVIMLLQGCIHGLKKEVTEFLQNFYKYDYLWKEDKQLTYEKFIKDCASKPKSFTEQHVVHATKRKEEGTENAPAKIGKPTLDHYETELKRYLAIEQEIANTPDRHNIGCLSLSLEKLKKSLASQANSWKVQYAKNLHDVAKAKLDKCLSMIDEYTKRLSIEIKSLEALRLVMNALKEIREKESMIEYKFNSIKDRYDILKKYNVDVPKDENDEVYDLFLKWAKVTQRANQVNEQVSKLQEVSRDS